MGVDALIGFEASRDYSDEELAAAGEAYRARFEVGPHREDPWYGYERRRSGWVELNSLERFYGPGYERGNWPAIYGMIRLTQALFPGEKVVYTGDTVSIEDAGGAEVSDESLDALWAHWCSPRWNTYREAWS